MMALNAMLEKMINFAVMKIYGNIWFGPQQPHWQ